MVSDAGVVQPARLAVGSSDELLSCLLIVAKAHGVPSTAEAVMAGLPAEQHRLTPSLFARAARRAHMSSRLVREPLTRVKDVLLPAVLLLKGERACVLLGWSDGRGEAVVVFPELGDAPVQVSRGALEADYLGTTVYVRPGQRFDARAPEVKAGRHGHWFWSVLAENHGLYRDVLLAALLANLFALGMPIFTMNVYDRVVPNNAMDTLWVLALGLSIMLVGDLVLRTLRGRFVDLASSRADVKLSAHIMEKVLGYQIESL